MGIVNTRNYDIANEYLKNSTVYQNSISNIDSVLSGLDSRILGSVANDLRNSKSILDSSNVKERDVSNKIINITKRYIEIENNAKARAESIVGAVAIGGLVAATTTPVAVPLVGAALSGAVVATSNPVKEFFVNVGKGILETGAKALDGAKTIVIGAFESLVNFGKKVGNAVVKIGEKVKSFINKFINGAEAFLKTAANLNLGGLCASVANLFMSLLEGVVSLGEAIGDAILILGGVFQSLVNTLPADLFSWVSSKIFKTEFSSATKALWTQDIMPSVGVNCTNKIFSALYDTKPFKVLEEWAWGPFKRDGGIVYSIGKGVGYTAGLIAVTIATAGIGTFSATAASSVAAGVGGMGKAAQSNYNKLSAEEKNNLGSIAKVVGVSSLAGAIEGIAWYLTFGDGKNILTSPDKIPKEQKLLTEISKKLQPHFTKNADRWNKGVNMIFDSKLFNNKLFNNKLMSRFNVADHFKHMYTASKGSMAKMELQVAKTYLNSMVTEAGAGHETFGEWASAAFSKETHISAATNAIISLRYDNQYSAIAKGIKNRTHNAIDKFASKTNPNAVSAASTQPAQTMTNDNLLFGATNSTSTTGQALQSAVQSRHALATKDEIVKACEEGIGKTTGGFIKKIMDSRKYPDIFEQFVGTPEVNGG